jgi:DNA-binding response OmpR family regulator
MKTYEKKKASLMLVEDDKNLGIIIQDFLSMSGYNVDLFPDGESAYKQLQHNRYDLLLLDVMLPQKDGFTLAEDVRKKDILTPIIFVTAKSMKEDKVRGFRLGADDYITKPFSTEELCLRIEAVLRRTQSTPALLENEVFNIGKFKFDYPNQVLTSDDAEQRLTRKEAELLRLFCLHFGQVIRRDFVLKNIWGDDTYFAGRSMDVYITKLRKLLTNDPTVSITNIHRTGFILEVLKEN